MENTTGVLTRGHLVRAGRVQNIVGRFAGRSSRKALMLVAHYDSVPEGSGAADDGAGVITILETIRALRTGAQLMNDLVVLFTDGEEAGLLGAAGFVADHPNLAREVGVTLNAEARGSSGPAMMFETSAGNGRLIDEFAAVAPYPMASSLMYSVYKLLPNDTDLSVLKRAGLTGMNFAFTETLQDYHTRLDRAENLDSRSIQHLGGNILALTKRLGNIPLDDMQRPDKIYFNWLGSRILVYPEWAAWVLSVFGFAGVGWAWRKGIRQQNLTASGLFLGFGSFVALLLTVSGGLALLWKLFQYFLTSPLLVGDTLSNQLLLAAFVLVGFAMGFCWLRFLSRKVGVFNLATGQLLAVVLLAAVLTYALPGC